MSAIDGLCLGKQFWVASLDVSLHIGWKDGECTVSTLATHSISYSYEFTYQ